MFFTLFFATHFSIFTFLSPVIFTNQCRGITHYSRERKKYLNTIDYFKTVPVNMNSIKRFRRTSLQRSLLVRPPGETFGSKKKQKNMKKKKRKYSTKKK